MWPILLSQEEARREIMRFWRKAENETLFKTLSLCTTFSTGHLYCLVMCPLLPWSLDGKKLGQVSHGAQFPLHFHSNTYQLRTFAACHQSSIFTCQGWIHLQPLPFQLQLGVLSSPAILTSLQLISNADTVAPTTCNLSALASVGGNHVPPALPARVTTN